MILVLRKALAGLPRSLDGIRSILLLPLLGVGLTGFLMFPSIFQWLLSILVLTTSFKLVR